jgi:hypothetical protein
MTGATDRHVSRPGKVARRGACILLPAAAATLLAACGGASTSAGGPGSRAAVVDQRVQSARSVPPIPRLLGSDKVSATRLRPVQARAQAGMIDDEVNATGAKTVHPCQLVSRAEARGIVGSRIGRPTEALQGPTCLYSQRSAKRLITLAVESNHFSKIRPQAQLRDRISLTVHGHAAYCGVASGPTMIVSLAAGRFLSVGAPCPIAASFAAKALAHLG